MESCVYCAVVCHKYVSIRIWQGEPQCQILHESLEGQSQQNLHITFLLVMYCCKTAKIDSLCFALRLYIDALQILGLETNLKTDKSIKTVENFLKLQNKKAEQEFLG